jgi:lysylphosphatidylglycerol synthetase-like protein (DUF2156 family)
MDRRRVALVLLLLFVACTGVAIVVSGSRPGLQQGLAPVVVQSVGHLFALAAAVLLLVPGAAGGPQRRTGVAVLAALVVLVVLEVVSRGGPDIGLGAVRLICLVVIGVATVRLAQGDAVAGRAR